MKPCTIVIAPWEREQAIIETGDVSVYECINILKAVQQIFARELLSAAEKAVGQDPKKQEEWINRQIEKYKNAGK